MKRLFRYFDAVELEQASGGTIAGRGLVARLKGDPEEARGSLPHQLGELTLPLYVFTGWLEEAAPGDVLCRGADRYRVLRAEPLAAGGQEVCLRALLERLETEETDGSV